MLNSLRDWDEYGFHHKFADAMYKPGMSAESPPDLISVSSLDRVARLIECKVVKGKSLPFDRLAEHQRKALTFFPGEAYVAILYYNGKRGKERLAKAYLVPIWHWSVIKTTLKRKSLPLSWLEEKGSDWEMEWLGKGRWNIKHALEAT